MGQVVTWRRAYQCPCVDEFSGAALASCPLCSGKGWQWEATSTEGVIGVTNQNVRKQFADFGNWEAGDMVATIGSDSPLYALGRYDRIVLKNSTDRFNRLFTHGVAPEKINLPVVNIERVFWLNPGKTATIEGGIPTVSDDGSMTWSSGEPPVGMQYSVTGNAYSEYYVYDMMTSDRNEHQGLQLPKKCQLKKWDLFGR